MVEETNHFVHVQIGVNDITKAVKFYNDIFSWNITVEKNWPKTALFEINTGGVHLEGSIQEMESSINQGNILLFIHCNDIENVLKKVTIAGGKVLQEKSKDPGSGGYVARFLDPFDNKFALWSEN